MVCYEKFFLRNKQLLPIDFQHNVMSAQRKFPKSLIKFLRFYQKFAKKIDFFIKNLQSADGLL